MSFDCASEPIETHTYMCARVHTEHIVNKHMNTFIPLTNTVTGLVLKASHESMMDSKHTHDKRIMCPEVSHNTDFTHRMSLCGRISTQSERQLGRHTNTEHNRRRKTGSISIKVLLLCCLRQAHTRLTAVASTSAIVGGSLDATLP